MKSGEIDVTAFRAAFYDWLGHIKFVTKDAIGLQSFVPFEVQTEFLDGKDGLFDTLYAGKRYLVTLKARQLGITTVSMLLDVFWAGLFPGLQGAIVYHEDDSKETFRLLLEEVLVNLPESHRLPVLRHNRTGIVLDTGGDAKSVLAYLVAGTKKKTGTLGRSRALNYCHMTEISSYGDVQGFESLKNTFSTVYPYAFYHEESTARGFNLYHDEWEDAGEDPGKNRKFLAWWMHELYRHERGTPEFEKYGHPELSDDEQKTAAIVARDYERAISLEQWAWYRHRADPRAREDFSQTSRDEREEMVEQEYPSYPEQAFIQTGSPFIGGIYLSPILRRARSIMFKGYRYRFGDSIITTAREPVDFARQAQLKIYQEPVPNATYVVAGDPAFASSDTSDRFCAQVIRCFADRVEQVAVFCERNMQSYEFVWVLLDLCGYYGNPGNHGQVRFILEINSAGVACLTEFRTIKNMVEEGRFNPAPEDPNNPTQEEIQAGRATQNMFSGIRQYLYRRPDSLLGGANWHWVTNSSNKMGMMIQFRDRVVTGECVINDVATAEEVKTLRQEGVTIEAEGHKKDDRAIALAMAVRAWQDQERTGLRSIGATYAAQQAQQTETGEEMASRYVSRLWQGEMAGKVQSRERRQRFERRSRWAW